MLLLGSTETLLRFRNVSETETQKPAPKIISSVYAVSKKIRNHVPIWKRVLEQKMGCFFFNND